MSDLIDAANDRAEHDLARAIQSARSGSVIDPTGECLYCEEPVAESVRWCCIECRDGYEREAAQRKRQGAR